MSSILCPTLQSKRRGWRLAALLVLMLAVQIAAAGCATPTKYTVEINGYTGRGANALRPATRIAVVPNTYSANPLLAAEVKAKIERLLQSRGFSPSSVDSADLVLLNVFGIGTPQEIATGAVALPLGNMIAYVPTSTISYFRWLMIGVAPAAQYGVAGLEFKDVDWSWVAEVTSSGSSGDLRTVIDYMLVAAFESFGYSTGRRVQVTLPRNDPRVRVLYGGQ